MAKRNRNQKRKNKEVEVKEEPKVEQKVAIPKENQAVEKTDIEEKKTEDTKTEDTQSAKENVVQENKIENKEKSKKNSSLLDNIFNIVFIVLFALPLVYYFLKIAPDNEAKWDKVLLTNHSSKDAYETRLSNLTTAKIETDHQLLLELEKEKKLQKDLDSAIKTASEKFEAKVNEDIKVQETLTQKVEIAENRIKELEAKLLEKAKVEEDLTTKVQVAEKTVKELEAKVNQENKVNGDLLLKLQSTEKKAKELEEKLFFVVKKGKELEDKLKNP